jgi:two-component system, OmpR family, response regulator
MRILVVDDDSTLGHALGRMLRDHDVTIECDPNAALERLRSGRCFDLVLVDVNLPGMNGYALASGIRAALGGDAPMLVLMSGGDITGSVPADAVLLKPFSGTELRAVAAMAEQRKLDRSHAATRRIPRLQFAALAG